MNYLDVTGRIFDIQRFSLHDGDGVRTIVFLKGCPFRCRWCCNPESQQFDIQRVTVGGAEKVYGRDVTVREVMEEVEKDRAYYRRSHGGLTLSGGECLAQPEFSAALLRAAKEAGLKTAIESTAYADFSVIETLLPYLDCYLMDIKHTDQRKHEEYTTKQNIKCLENAVRIAASGTHLIIRTPVIPGFNDTEKEIGEIARFAAGLPRVREMHLLPYHAMGADKYERLNREYTLKDLKPPPPETMARLQKTVEDKGLKGQIGG